MSVLLQNIKTAKYVEHSTGWTERPERAKKFTGATEALFYCCNHELWDMKILGRFRDPKKNFSIPLTEIGWGNT